MSIAAQRKQWFINRDTLRFLDAMVSRSGNTATTDDAVGDLSGTFADGGKWRGSIPQSLAKAYLIFKVGVAVSERHSRHRGYVALWQAADLGGIKRKRDELRSWLTAHPYLAVPIAETLFDNFEGDSAGSDVY